MRRQFPVIITVRDRLSPLLQLLEWLGQIGQHDVWLCDNASTYPPLVSFLDQTTHHVIRNERNLGHRAPWLSGLAAELGAEQQFIVTDPDVVPCETCPGDAVEYFAETLRVQPEIDKVGFSLRIDDLPEHYAHRESVINWEEQFWTNEYKPGFYFAPIDTTFAVYRAGFNHHNGRSLRSQSPYIARHLPWYDDSSHPTEEQTYYSAHADRLVTNWNVEQVPAAVRARLRFLKAAQRDPQ